MYDLLNNFQKRMEKLSYSYLIDRKASMLTFYKIYFTDIELINIIYTLMVYILEKSLKDEDCTLDDMTAFLYDIINNYFSISLSIDKVQELTHDIVYKILRNDGKPFIFETIDYESKKRHSYSYHLVQQKNSRYDENKSTFYLEKAGYRLILNSLEVDERLQIDLNQMILELSLKKKNFSDGVDAVENLQRLITAQIQVIKNFTLRIRENILTISSDEFEKNYLQNINVLKEQNSRFYELFDLIVKEEEQLQSIATIDVKKYESLKHLNRIKEGLKIITEKASSLIGYHFQFKDEYEEALEHFSFYYENKRLNIKEHLLKPLEEDANKLKDIYPFFNALFNKKCQKHFNLNYIFNTQDLISNTIEEKEVSVITVNTYDQDKKLAELKTYTNMINLILSFVCIKKETSLKELIGYYENHPDYEILVPSVRKLAEVLIKLLSLGTIEINEVISETYVFSIKRMIAAFFNERNDHFKYISFIKSKNTLEISDKNKIITILKCPNIMMKVG